MALSAAYENNATIADTEYSLPNNSTSLTAITVDGIYSCLLDLVALTATETYTFKIYEKVKAGGTARVIYQTTFVGKQPPFVTPALMLLHGWDMTMKRDAGTSRDIIWSIRTAV